MLVYFCIKMRVDLTFNYLFIKSGKLYYKLIQLSKDCVSMNVTQSFKLQTLFTFLMST